MSPLLANIYLHPLDHVLAAAGLEMVRYADDFVILCRSEADAQRALTLIARWTEAAELTLHPEKTRIVDATQRGGFDFLGYHFERGHHWPRATSVRKLKDALRAKTHRNQGQSLAVIIADVTRTLRGWFAYFQHSPRHWFARSMAGFACVCAAACVGACIAVVAGAVAIISVGPTHSLPRTGSST